MFSFISYSEITKVDLTRPNEVMAWYKSNWGRLGEGSLSGQAQRDDLGSNDKISTFSGLKNQMEWKMVSYFKWENI